MRIPANILKNRAVLLGTAVFISLSAAGVALHTMSRAQAQQVPVSADPATPVGVETLHVQNVRIWSEFSGRMRAVDYAEIRPEVGGRIMEVRFKDGQTVKTGEILFVIDPRPYEAAVARAEANLAAADSNAGFAKAEFDRAATLIKTHVIPQYLYDQRANDNRVAQAAILTAAAELKLAQTDLDHAYVKAPITGRISRPEITLGNLVQTGPNAPVLASIVSNDGIYADFEVDEQTYMKIVRARAGTAQAEQRMPVELVVQGDEDHPYAGTLDSFDNRIDTSSGTIRARARYANRDGSLVPGMFVSVKLAGSSDSAALLVPDRAIGNDQGKVFVYVVGADNKVAYREVSLGAEVAGRRIVLSGLHAGEKVIVDGLQHVRPDMTVQAQEVPVDEPGHAPSRLALN